MNIVSPGLTLTQEVIERLTPEERERHEQRVPLRRVGRVEDTANVALFLASELGDYVNGQTITVDGGFLAGGVPADSEPLEPGQPGAME